MTMEHTPFIEDGEIAIRRMRDELSDYHLMARWLTDERVLEFYEGRDNPHDLTKIQEKYSPRVMGVEQVIPCILLYQDRPIGYIQYYPLAAQQVLWRYLDSAQGVYSLDLFIGEAHLWDQGIGTRAVSAMTRYLFEGLDAQRVTIDPRVSNHRAVRCYEKAGFRKIRLLPRQELHEGEHWDCWLMVMERS